MAIPKLAVIKTQFDIEWSQPSILALI